MLSTIPDISGQWLGRFTYGSEYGELSGKEVTFNLVVENIGDGQFQGKCHEIEGIGSNPNVSTITGYVEDAHIQFVKDYPIYYSIEPDGSMQENKSAINPLIMYEGDFEHEAQKYVGAWEIETNHGETLNGYLLSYSSGTWEMHKVSSAAANTGLPK
ncbi:MAG: hypothetical protein EOO10_21190 [Chitinophagaceae bacterium]|nr:MAG: hypothetical protein EOO10_21190 [Chitinophagaceae bacterium]